MNLISAIDRLAVPELKPLLGMSLRDAERQLESTPIPEGYLDATYADTGRFPPPEWALSTFISAAEGAGMTYTPYRGDRGVREAVAENVETSFGLDVSKEADLIVTPGTQGALFIALAATLEPGDVVLLPDPDYLSTERMLRYFGAEVIRIPIRAGENGRSYLDRESLQAAVQRRPKLMVFSHPNNPTGAMFDDETLHHIARLAVEHDFSVLADQLYCRLVYDGATFTHIAALDGMASRTITLLGPSKTESLSGYRIGVAVAPKAVVDTMEDVQACTALRAPAYAQHLLTHWLRDDQAYLQLRIKEYQSLRDMTVKKIENSSVARVRQACGTAYLFPEILTGASAQQVSMALRERAGIVVNPGYQFGPSGLNHVRLCFAQEESRWDAALDSFLEVVETTKP